MSASFRCGGGAGLVEGLGLRGEVSVGGGAAQEVCSAEEVGLVEEAELG